MQGPRKDPAAFDPPKTWELAVVLSMLGATLGVYKGAFQGFFVQDDFGWLESSRFQTIGEYLDSYFRFNPASTYRPLSQETFFWLGQKLFDMWPPGFHFVSMLFHLFGATLVYLLLRQFLAVVPSLVGSLFLSVHNAHLISVYWISSLPEPMALVFFLSAVLLFLRFDRENSQGAYALSLLAMVLGLMSKESILSLPLVLVAYCSLFSRRRLPWTIPFIALSGLYVSIRAGSAAVKAAPYALTFGEGVLKNLLVYLTWTAGFSETLLKLKLKWDIGWSYPVLATSVIVALIVLFIISRDRRLALFSILWFLAALQPVLYFSEHIFGYYLAPALPAVSLLLAAALPPARRVADWRGWIVALAVVGMSLWLSLASIRREGKWWNDRTYVARDILSRMPALERQVPDGHVAYVFGFGADEFGILQNDSAFKAYGFSPNKFILVGLDERTPGQMRRLKQSGGLKGYYCFLYSGGDFINGTVELREYQPLGYLDRPDVRLEANLLEIQRGKDTLILRLFGLDAAAIDLAYTIDGKRMPSIAGWRLDENREASVFVDNSTRTGLYRFLAIRDAREASPLEWIRVDVEVLVR